MDQEIMRLRGLINESEEKLTYFSGSELTRENYHCANLYLTLRKYTVIANRDKNVFFCSRCGQRLYSARERIIHVMEDHERL